MFRLVFPLQYGGTINWSSYAYISEFAVNIVQALSLCVTSWESPSLPAPEYQCASQGRQCVPGLAGRYITRPCANTSASQSLFQLTFNTWPYHKSVYLARLERLLFLHTNIICFCFAGVSGVPATQLF